MNKDLHDESSQDWKILSVRLPVEEARYVDEMAKKSGLNRSRYIRMRIKESETFLSTEKLEDLILASRQIEQVLERYVDVLEEIYQVSRESLDKEIKTQLKKEIERALTLIDLTFRVQKQSVRLIQRMHKKISEPINR